MIHYIDCLCFERENVCFVQVVNLSIFVMLQSKCNGRVRRGEEYEAS